MSNDEVVVRDLSTGRTVRSRPGCVIVEASDGSVEEHSIGHDEIAEHTPISLAIAGKVVVAQCRQAMSNSETIHVVFVFAAGTAAPILAVPSDKALAAFDWDDGWTTGVTAWALAPSGTQLATWWTGEGLAVWNVTTRKRKRVLRKPDPDEDVNVLALAFDAAGERLAVLVDGALEVYACATGEKVHREDIAETFGESQLAFAGDTVTWTRVAPGTSEQRGFEIG